jgi:hypothetical protein
MARDVEVLLLPNRSLSALVFRNVPLHDLTLFWVRQSRNRCYEKKTGATRAGSHAPSLGLVHGHAHAHGRGLGHRQPTQSP